jgi:hypothetical protein
LLSRSPKLFSLFLPGRVYIHLPLYRSRQRSFGVLNISPLLFPLYQRESLPAELLYRLRYIFPQFCVYM